VYHVGKVSLVFGYNFKPEIFLFHEILIDFLSICAPEDLKAFIYRFRS